MVIGLISTKGQIALPAGFRKRLRMKPHDRVIIELTGDAIVIKRAEDFFELEGFLGKALPEAEERKQMAQAVFQRMQGRIRR